MKKITPARRKFIQSSVFGMLTVTTGSLAYANGKSSQYPVASGNEPLFYRYPSLNDKQVEEVVGAAHTNLDTVKELVTRRPELALATWDWGFGDWETALGSASHMGRRDIAEFLMSHGARPDIFTFAMLGAVDAVKSMVLAAPGIQRTPGPHGITLLQHAKNRLRQKDLQEEEISNIQQVITYLESLGDADIKAKSLDISEEEKAIYLGEYRFGEREDEVFEIGLNMRKLLQIGRKGKFGRVMNRIDDQLFSPGGAPSVQISFVIRDGKAVSLTIHEPEPLITAMRM